MKINTISVYWIYRSHDVFLCFSWQTPHFLFPLPFTTLQSQGKSNEIRIHGGKYLPEHIYFKGCQRFLWRNAKVRLHKHRHDMKKEIKWEVTHKLDFDTVHRIMLKTENCNYGCGMIFALENSSRTCLWRNSHKQKILINANFLEWEMYCHFFSEQVE